MSAGPPIRYSKILSQIQRDDYALSNKRQLRNFDLVICEGKCVWKASNLPHVVNVPINYLRL